MTQKFIDLYRSLKLSFLAALFLAVAAVLWAYWPTLGEMAQRWARDPQYSHGYLVPFFALALLWLRRSQLTSGTVQGSWLGVPLLALGIALRLIGGFYYYIWLDAISLLPCLAGLVLILGGWPAWRWSWPAIAFLTFMIPLPYRLSVTLAGPLQNFATISSTFCLQTLGLPALAEGNVILLNEIEIGIVEACSGLRMLVIFFALSTAFVLVIRRPLWEKVLIVASAVPIALVVNVIRITATGVLYQTVGSEWAHAVFHDLAGWLMMPLALGILGLECKLLKNLFLDPPSVDPARFTYGLRAPQPANSMRTPAPAAQPTPAPRASRRRQPTFNYAARRGGGA
jgi:exosortase